MKKTILLIIGKKGTGKTTTANQVIKNYDGIAELLSLATPIKTKMNKVIEEEFGKEYLEDSNLKEKIRPLYQGFGEAGRRIDKTFWIKRVIKLIEQSTSDLIIIDDIRFQNELTAFDAYKTVSVRMDRESIFKGVDTHESEVGLNGIPKEYYDFNLKDANDKQEIKRIINKIISL